MLLFGVSLNDPLARILQPEAICCWVAGVRRGAGLVFHTAMPRTRKNEKMPWNGFLLLSAAVLAQVVSLVKASTFPSAVAVPHAAAEEELGL